MGLAGDGGIEREAILIGRECFREGFRSGEARLQLPGQLVDILSLRDLSDFSLCQ